jgi:dienelactone hydrolase
VPAFVRRRVCDGKHRSASGHGRLVGLACAILLGVSSLALTGQMAHAASGNASAHLATAPTGPFAVGEIVITFTDNSRHVALPGRRHAPRVLQTVIRYPALGDPSSVDVRNAPPASADGPFPLIVFAHGFNSTPDTYSRLLRAWAQAGHVVAAPTFPLTNAKAPGGGKESDLVNQPRDMSFVISRMLAGNAAGYGVLSGLINPNQIAVAGHSDGGSTALAVAYNRHYVDHRIRAAVILSGAEIPGVHGYDFPAPSPPLLAVQGTADTSNVPASTRIYFHIAPAPKFLLSLLGAGHGPPYISQQPDVGIVEHVTAAFLDAYLKGAAGAGSQMWNAGNVSGMARLSGYAPLAGHRRR